MTITSRPQRPSAQYAVEVTQEHWPSNPREWRKNASTMICFHERYVLGDTSDLTSDMFSDWEDPISGWVELERTLVREYEATVRVPVGLIDQNDIALYAHSGPHHSDSSESVPGQVGWIFMTAQQIKDFFDVPVVNDTAIHQAEQFLRSEIAAYSMYLSGDVWQVTVRDEHGEIVDSLGDVYGRADADAQAATMLQAYVECARNADTATA